MFFLLVLSQEDCKSLLPHSKQRLHRQARPQICLDSSGANQTYDNISAALPRLRFRQEAGDRRPKQTSRLGLFRPALNSHCARI